MKNLFKSPTLIAILTLATFSAQSQVYHSKETLSGDTKYTTKVSNQKVRYKKTVDTYNRWSVFVQGGVTKASKPYTAGYSGKLNVLQGTVGGRFMVTNIFGLQLDFGYNQFKGSSPSYDSHQLRTTAQLVLNGGSLLHFRNWTDNFTFYVHGGAGAFRFYQDESLPFPQHDVGGILTIGIAPELRVSDRLGISLDYSIYGNMYQNLNFDGTHLATREQKFKFISGSYSNLSLGLTYYIGERKIRKDWGR